MLKPGLKMLSMKMMISRTTRVSPAKFWHCAEIPFSAVQGMTSVMYLLYMNEERRGNALNGTQPFGLVRQNAP